jgi:hypothetical protein
MPQPTDLTRHHPEPPRYFARDILSGRDAKGYTPTDLFKFHALITGLLFALAYSYTRYFELFDNIHEKSIGYKAFVLAFSLFPLLLVLSVLLGFIWWAAGALVRYARWQLTAARFWHGFWVVVLSFYAYVVIDPLDRIHPSLSRQGMAPAPNLLKLFDGELELFQFQWGYFLLWALLWFLVAAVHYSYLMDGLRESWFYLNRINRYGASVLTGFRETLKVYSSAPVTGMYPAKPAELPEAYRGVPYLRAAELTAEQAASIVAVDTAGAFASVPGQPAALFVDLGAYVHSSELEQLLDAGGQPLLGFEPRWTPPSADREALVVPLRRRPHGSEHAAEAGA